MSTEVVSSFEEKLSFVCFLTTSFSEVSVNMTLEVAFSPNDDYIVCGDCNRSCIFGDCPDHGPLEWIDDRQVPQGTQSTCRDSLPSNLCLCQMGVFARERIEKRAMFGPFRGQKIPLKEMNFEGSANIMNMWEVFEGGTVSYIIDGTDEDHSNWMRFVNCARDDKEQNLLQVQYRGEIYFKTLVPVEAGSELLVWYQDSCVKPLDGSSHQTGHDFVCDVCKLDFSGPTFLLRHKSVRCPGIAQVPYLVHQPEAQDNGTPINGGSSTDPVGQTESSYVVVHLEPNAIENRVTKIDTVEDSPYVVVHVQPAPTTSSNNLGTGKRRKRILAGDKTANASKKPKPVNTRQRAAVNREKEAKKVASKARSTVDAVKEAKKVGSKGRLTKARGRPSSKVQTVKNAAANKSLTPKRTKETKRTSTSSASRSRGGTVRKVKQNETVQSKSAAPTESVSSSTLEESGDAKKDGQRATDGNKALKKTSARKAASKGAKTRSREIQKQYDKSKSSSSRKRRSEDIATAESDDISIEKQKQTADKTTGKENNAKASEKKGRYIPAKKQKAPVLKEKPAIKCEICRKNFKWKSQLNYHMRCHTSEKEFKCPFCNKGLSQMSSLKRHLRVHSGEKPHQCEECGKRFLEKTRLIYHLRKHRGHEPEKKYKCGFCDKRFTLNANMKTHERTHTGEKPYPCPQCGKMFRRSSDISSHLRSHTGERPYKCSHCPKAFTMISHRKRHEIIHTGERPFKCDICGKGFTQPNSVKAHLKVHARKEALAESRGDDAVQRPRESVSSNAAAVQTTDEGESRGEIAQNSGAEQMQIDSAPGPGSTTGTSAVITSTETLSSTQTKPIGTERSHQGDDDLTQVGIQHQGAASLLLLGTIPEGQTGLFNLRNTGVSETAAQSIGDHLQLSCTNAEQFTIVSSQVNAGLMPLPCIPQVGFDCENVPLQLDQSGGQNHVHVNEGEETASTLLAL